MKFEFSAGGIIFKKEGKKILIALILDSYDQWTFPKGHIEKGEKPAVAAVREVGEEIGVKELRIIKLLKKIDYWYKRETVLIHKFVYFYLMEAPVRSQLNPQIAEIKAARWLNPKEALAILGYKKDSKDLLKLAFKDLKIVI